MLSLGTGGGHEQGPQAPSGRGGCERGARGGAGGRKRREERGRDTRPGSSCSPTPTY